MNDLEFGVGVYPEPVPQEWYITQLLQNPTPAFELEQEIAKPMEEPA